MRSWPYYSENEVAVATAVLKSGKVNYWTGEEGRNFEKEFANYCGVKHAVAVSNGTVALELALRIIGVGPGDEVVVPSRTFIATASSVVSCGANPVFADVDRNSQNITAASIGKVISSRTKAVIAVHLSGLPCEMNPILALSRQHKIKVIEDCAQAHGAVYKGQPVGSLGDIGTFSFCQDKIISTGGEGGMLVTNDTALWKKAWSYKDHGKSFDAVYNQSHPPGFRWLHHSFGTNWRMTEMQAAIGRIQLCKLPTWRTRRNRNALILTNRFRKIPGLRVIEIPSHVDHAYYKYDVFIRPHLLADGWNRDRIMAAINSYGITCTTGSCSEIYLEKAFDESGMRPAQSLPAAKELGLTGLTFLVHPMLSDIDIAETCKAVETVMEIATKEITTPLYALDFTRNKGEQKHSVQVNHH